MPTRRTPPFFCAPASRAAPMTSPTARNATISVRSGRSVMLHLRWPVPDQPPLAPRAPSPPSLLVHPDVVEAGPLRLLVEALDLPGGRPEPVEVAVGDRRHLLVEEPRLLLPEREPLPTAPARHCKTEVARCSRS